MEATCSPRCEQLRWMLTRFTIPAPRKARGELGSPPSVLGRTRKGVLLRLSVLGHGRTPLSLHEGSYSLGPNASESSKTKKAPPFQKELPGCKKTTPGPPSRGPFVSFPDLRGGGRGKTANSTEPGSARGVEATRAGGVGEKRNHRVLVRRWGWRSELQRLCCLLPTRDHTTGSHCSQV